ncbi:hypothetical protein [Curtobacterium sp. MCPF17_046]|uniref:hypothetical protein n=1 Tax=Curtobacterium sp. MCPF17_046 TaxID=2175663 RepID=UPI0011B72CD4|nr:hypothetical protein [Curtobacterium sp. MCPF17_046]
MTDTVGAILSPVTDTASSVLEPVTGAVGTVADGGPVTAVVDTIDQVVGSLPVVGALLGDDTLGGVTAPVTGIVDDTLGTVGGVVTQIPGVVAELPTVVDQVPGVVGGLPTGPVLPDGPLLPGGSLPGVDVPSLPVVPGSGTGPAAGPAPVATTTPVGDRPVRTTDGSTGSAAEAPAMSATADVTSTRGTADPRTVALGHVATDPVATVTATFTEPPPTVTVDGAALVLPLGGAPVHTPFDGGTAGTTGGSTSGGSAGANLLGTVGAEALTSPLAAGLRGSVSDDAVPASLVGDHDVAPD